MPHILVRVTEYRYTTVLVEASDVKEGIRQAMAGEGHAVPSPNRRQLVASAKTVPAKLLAKLQEVLGIDPTEKKGRSR